MKVVIAQLNSIDDVKANLEVVLELIESAKKIEAELIIFPENTLFFRIKNSDRVKAIRVDGDELLQISNRCKELRISAHLTTPISDEVGVYNASVLISQDGVIRKLYDKMHLFDIELIGQKPIRESDVFLHGSNPQVFDFGGLKFASSICYDIRFAELYAWYARKNVDVILIPAAFLVKTGLAHWEVLLRARAIESQAYVLAPAQSGVHRTSDSSETRETFGHSMVVSPWGEVLALKTDGVGLIAVDLSVDELQKVRRQIPMAGHRRHF